MKLYREDSGTPLGDVTEEDVRFLIDQLEEEYEEDTAYYLTVDTVAMLRDRGARPELLALLERAVTDAGGAVEVRWAAD